MSETGRQHWLAEGRPRLGLALLLLAVLSMAMLLFEGARPAASAGLAPFPHFDKVLHFGAHCWVASLLFAGGMLLARPAGLRRRLRVWIVVVLLLDGLAGVAVEYVQLWLGARYGRQFDWKDVVANLSGTVFALVAGFIVSFLLMRRAR
ncbi:MAG: hypothetical protein KDB82_02595 [Planctomycetes bacterium]|nr:hypothetical protein [Planctomycetota bacterium]